MARRPIPIRAELTADTDRFRRGMRQATADLDRSASQMQQRFRRLSAAMGAAFGTAAITLTTRALDQAARSAIRYGDEIGKAARTAGIGASSLQELRVAAERAGETTAGLDNAVGRFNRRLGEAKNGNEAYRKAFEQLGVTMRMTTEQALDRTLVSLAGVEDHAVRTSFATKVFGDDARRMALIVADGADALEAARKQARAYGHVIADDVVASLEGANDRLADMERVLKNRLAEAVAQNIDGFLAWKQVINDVQVSLVNMTGGAAGAARGFIGRVGLQMLDAEIRQMERFGTLTEEAAAHLEMLRRERTRVYAIATGAPFGTLEEMRAALASRAAAPQIGEGAGTAAAPSLPGFRVRVPTLKKDAEAKNREAAAQAIEKMVAKTRTPLEEFRARMAEIEKLRPFAHLVEGGDEALDRFTAQMHDLRAASDAAAQAQTQWGRSISDSFADAVVWGERLDKVFAGLIRQLASRALSNLIFNAVGGSLGGAFANIAGARAAGGPVMAGRNYLVGERGPELFTPSANGTILPGGAGGGVAVTLHNHFDVGLEAVEERIAALTPGIAGAVTQAIQKAQRRPKFG